MKQSRLFSKTSKNISKDEVSINAKLLNRAGFIDKLMAGVYSYLPLGKRVCKKIEDIIREEMNKIEGQEVFLPALQPKENWETTGRWESFDVLFKVKSKTNNIYALGPTHEEVIVPLVKKFVQSYKDLPLALYQIQTKFRDEKRAKSGLLRGREFIMKDMYSFHKEQSGLENYYQKVITSYNNIFRRCGLDVIITEASGGSFTKKFSHEFQALTPFGEDTIVFCPSCHWAQNIEITDLKEKDSCPNCKKEIKSSKSIEVGNIFDLGTKFSNDFNLNYTDKDGTEKIIIMGCYGLGISRLMGAIVEVLHDDNGMIWPKEVSPYQVHLLSIGNDSKILEKADEIYKKLSDMNVDILYDDRETSAGEKFSDSDLMGISVRLVVSEKTKDKIELKFRGAEKVELFSFDEIVEMINNYYKSDF